MGISPEAEQERGDHTAWRMPQRSGGHGDAPSRPQRPGRPPRKGQTGIPDPPSPPVPVPTSAAAEQEAVTARARPFMGSAGPALGPPCSPALRGSHRRHVGRCRGGPAESLLLYPRPAALLARGRIILPLLPRARSGGRWQEARLECRSAISRCRAGRALRRMARPGCRVGG